MDPIYIALGGAVSALAGLIYKDLTSRVKSAEEDRDFWREKALTAMGLAEIATDVARKRSRKK